MRGRLLGNSPVLVELEEGGGVYKVATLAIGADGLDLAELVEGLLELAGEPLTLYGEVGQKRDEGLGIGVLGEQGVFESWDAVEAPGSVGDFHDELRCGHSMAGGAEGDRGSLYAQSLPCVTSSWQA